MNRYFCLAPDSSSARDCLKKLMDEQFDEHLISLVANANLVLDEISMEDESKTWEALDVLQRSIARGGSPGMFAGLRAVTLPSVNITLVGRAIFCADLVNLGFQVILSHSLHLPASAALLQRLHDQIAAGKALLILGVAPQQAAKFERFAQQTCPEIRFNCDAVMTKGSGDARVIEQILN